MAPNLGFVTLPNVGLLKEFPGPNGVHAQMLPAYLPKTKQFVMFVYELCMERKLETSCL
jgi:hypothetical protein